MRTSRLLAVLTAFGVAVAGAGCSGAGDHAAPGAAIERTGSPMSWGDEQGGLVVARAQRSTGKVVVLDEVSLPADGYVAIYDDGHGAPGKLLAASGLLSKGVQREVTVTLDAPLPATETVYAMIHTEDGTAAGFNYPAGDPPVSDGGSIVVTPVQITLAG
jgi:hypothetical protein